VQVEQGGHRAGGADLTRGDQRGNLAQREPVDPLGLERGVTSIRIETYLVIGTIATYAVDIS
jgi:hypothetical protein